MQSLHISEIIKSSLFHPFLLIYLLIVSCMKHSFLLQLRLSLRTFTYVAYTRIIERTGQAIVSQEFGQCMRFRQYFRVVEYLLTRERLHILLKDVFLYTNSTPPPDPRIG